MMSFYGNQPQNEHKLSNKNKNSTKSMGLIKIVGITRHNNTTPLGPGPTFWPILPHKRGALPPSSSCICSQSRVYVHYYINLCSEHKFLPYKRHSSIHTADR